MTEIQDIPIDNLYYDFEFLKGGDTQKYRAMFHTLEKTLPEIPKIYTFLVESRFPLLNKIFSSIKTQGLKNPLIVLKVEERIFRVKVGNQRLVCLRALGHNQSVPCHVTPDRAKTIQDQVEFVKIPGIDRSHHV